MTDAKYFATSHSINPADGKPMPNIVLSGSNLQEQLTETSAVAGVLTFSENLNVIEIYNTDTVNIGVFLVNGLTITVLPGKSWKDGVGGTPGKTVTVTGATSYIVSRYG